MTKARDIASAAPAPSTVSATELGYLDGVTSAVQTQLDAKAPSSTAVTLTGTQTLTNKTLTNPVIASVINNTLTSTTGDIIYASSANTPARLGIGSTGNVLTVASGIPSWAAPAGGATYAGVSVQKTAQQSLSSGTFTLVSWDSENFDTDAYHDNSTNNSRITIPTGKGGKYLLSGGLRFTSGSAAGNRAATLYKNGTDINYIFFQPPTTTTNDNVQPFSFVVSLTAGDYLQLYAYQNSGTTLNLDNLSYWQVSYLGA